MYDEIIQLADDCKSTARRGLLPCLAYVNDQQPEHSTSTINGQHDTADGQL
jgi:hypothetical protein